MNKPIGLDQKKEINDNDIPRISSGLSVCISDLAMVAFSAP